MNSKTVFLLLLCMGLVSIGNSCKSRAKVIEQSMEPQLIFLNFRLKKNTSSNIEAKLINTIITKGKMKQSKRKDNPVAMGDLICRQLGKKRDSLYAVPISNPLVREFEFVNEEGEFQRKTVIQDSGDVNIRMPLYPNTKFITLELKGETDNTQLAKIKL